MYKKHQIYLDNSATSYPKPKSVIDSVNDYLLNCASSPSRGVYESALDSSLIQIETRELICKLYDANNFKNVILTSGITHSINQLILGSLSSDDHVIISPFEHNAVVRVLEMNNIQYSILRNSKGGFTDFSKAKELIQSNTKALIFNLASNVFGLIQPIDDAKQFARENNLFLFVDTAQATPIVDLDIDGITAIAFTSHKGLMGIKGTGGFVSDNSEFLLNLKPLISGGTGSKSALLKMPNILPDYLEAGTPNMVGIVGLNAALKYYFNNREILQKTYRDRISRVLDGLTSIDEVEVYGDLNVFKRTGAISFNVSDIDPSLVAYELNERGVELRVGLHCAPLAHKSMNTYPSGTNRLSPGVFTSVEEIDLAIQALKEVVKKCK